MVRSIVTAVLIVLGPALAVATPNDYDIQTLYRWCKSPEGTPNWNLCVGYIAGVADVLTFLAVQKKLHPEDNNPIQLCGAPSYGALMQAFVNWAEKNPRDWSNNRITGVLRSIAENWPCQ